MLCIFICQLKIWKYGKNKWRCRRVLPSRHAANDSIIKVKWPICGPKDKDSLVFFRLQSIPGCHKLITEFSSHLMLVVSTTSTKQTLNLQGETNTNSWTKELKSFVLDLKTKVLSKKYCYVLLNKAIDWHMKPIDLTSSIKITAGASFPAKEKSAFAYFSASPYHCKKNNQNFRQG